MITARSLQSPAQIHKLAPPTHTPSVEIQLPAALWVAKLTAGENPADLFNSAAHGVPAHWLHSPLSTGRTYRGILSAADVGLHVQPNLCPTESLPLPGDRIIITRTGRRVEVFGAVEITALTVSDSGAVKIGHRPLVRFTEPVDLRAGRRHNHLLEQHWDQLFGRSARDRRLLPLSNRAVALTFTAFGFSLEQLFASAVPEEMNSVDPAAAWNLDDQIAGVAIVSTLATARIANSVAVFHGLAQVFEEHQPNSIEVTGNRSGRDLLLSVTDVDHTHFVIAAGLSLNESYRVSPAYRNLILDGAASTVLAMEGPDDWNIFNLDASECISLQQIENERFERRN